MSDAFLEQRRPAGGQGGRRYEWQPPQHPDVTLYTPTQAPEEDRVDAAAFEQPMPVWGELEYVEIGHLKTHGFAIAASDRAVLVDTTWRGRLQRVWVPRPLVTHRTLRPRGRVDAEVDQIRRDLSRQGSR